LVTRPRLKGGGGTTFKTKRVPLAPGKDSVILRTVVVVGVDVKTGLVDFRVHTQWWPEEAIQAGSHLLYAKAEAEVDGMRDVLAFDEDCPSYEKLKYGLEGL
jgi:hypothetical protein